MRFVTRCPSCGTSFRVVVDQLRIADGWVRCGWCQRVFDATQDLQPEPPAPVGPAGGVAEADAADATPAPATAAPASAGDGAAGSGPDAALPSDPGATVRADDGPSEAEPVQAETPAATVASEVGAQARAPAGPPPVAPADGGPESAAGADAPPPRAAEAAAAPLRADLDDALRPPAPPEPAFVRAARRRARWRHPAVRVALAVLALGLAALLAAQAAWLARAPLLARWPALQPLAEVVCARLGCSLGPRRDVEAVVVEGSVLLRRAPDRYSFHLVLRNRTDAEVAVPALELTLLDEREQPLVRRVWLPQEWPQPATVLAAGAEWPLQFELAFDHPQASRMSGYRVVLFHP